LLELIVVHSHRFVLGTSKDVRTPVLQLQYEESLDDTNVRTFTVAIPLASTPEKCLFTIKPGHTVKSFLDSLKEEESTISRAALYSSDGSKIASSTALFDVIKSGFTLHLDSNKFKLVPVGMTLS
jgi:hypothetical protein